MTRTDQIGVLDASLAQPVPQIPRPLHQVRGGFLDGTDAGRVTAVGSVLSDDVLRGGRRWLHGCQLGQDVRLDVRCAKRTWNKEGRNAINDVLRETLSSTSTVDRIYSSFNETRYRVQESAIGSNDRVQHFF